MNRAPRSSTPFPYTTLFRSDLLDREMRGVLVVALGDGPGEPVRHPDLFSFPCFFACTSPRWKIASPIGVAATAMISSGDRKSTRLNSSHANISYAVFCLKKK